mmetsp:Transcript_19193/g.53525  ORF Transcript_19193/g.53525 Transcript_19193/m.53525 type:complete len:121 (-) Transcript_19193:46-408(-)
MLVDLGQRRLLLCDLDLPRVYINITSLSATISAGRVQWGYGEERFHSNAWCFSDEQCHACFKTSLADDMLWIPEASCDASTGRCRVGAREEIRVVMAVRGGRVLAVPVCVGHLKGGGLEG